MQRDGKERGKGGKANADAARPKLEEFQLRENVDVLDLGDLVAREKQPAQAVQPLQILNFPDAVVRNIQNPFVH